MRISVRVIFVILIFTLLPVYFSGCAGKKAEPKDDIFIYNSFRDIPGVTEDEIRSVEALRKQYDSFVFGMNPGTEAFIGVNGEINGFTSLFCLWLTGLFDIPFIPALYEWGDLISGLESGEINFTGDLTATDERLKTYYMTSAIAERSVKLMRISGSASLMGIAEWRQLRYAFLDGATTFDDVYALMGHTFESFFVDDYSIAYDLIKSGTVDAFIDEGVAEAAFDIYGDVIAEDFFPMIYSPVSLSTQTSALQPVIGIVQKALQHGVASYLTRLYNQGHNDYIRHKWLIRLSPEEKAYIQENPVVSFVAEFDNYPVSFYNLYEKQWQGIVFDVLDQVEELTSLRFEIRNEKNTQWPVIIRMLEEGEASMITELIRNEDREGRFLWPHTTIFTDYYALLSKSDRRNINVNEILYLKIGFAKETAHAELFRRWFPNHMKTFEYDTINQAFDAMERGEVDMIMSSQSQLLILTNYHERPGFKANIVFDRPFNSTFGFNINEQILCSIIDKTLPLIDTEGISGQWIRRTYDYREKMIRSQLPWLIGALVLLLLVLILLLVLFRRNRNEGKRLEELVKRRTTEVSKQNLLMHIVNDVAAFLLESETDDHLVGMIRGMELIGRSVDVDRVSVWQNHRKPDGRLYYKAVCQWAAEGLPELDMNSYFAYDELVPSWESMFSRGEWVNGPVDTLPEPERSVLTAFTMKSILAVPIFLKGDFWGFVSFDDYHNRRVFPEAELLIIRSWGLLIVSAIQRQEIAMNMKRTLKKLEVVTNNYKGLIWSVNSEGIITTFNGQYLKKIEVESSLIEGKNLEIAQLKNRHLDIIEHIGKIFREGLQDCTDDIDGGIFHSFTTPIYDDEGSVTGVVGSTDDVTELYKLQRDLEEALEDAKAANRAKSVFLANMSHEIRTPMNAIIGMTSIGKNASDNEKKDYCFTKIDDASKHLLGIINDILDMSKIEANKFELSHVDFSFERMLQSVVNVVNFRVEEKNQKFTVHIGHDIPHVLVGDDQRLAQVITNLVGNSVKFTPKGGTIILDTRLTEKNEDFCTIQVSVTDNGIGISQEQQARLFQSFQQAESNTTRKFGGTGLGLSISKNIVEMMGGRIWVNSELGKGSTFAFSIQAKLGVEKETGLKKKEINWKDIRILAVDDDPDVLEFFRDTLNQFGADCDVAENGEDALKLVEEKGSYQVYFVDWKLPGLDGIELTKKLKSLAAPDSHATVVMITAANWSSLEEEAKEAGVDMFLGKPLFPLSIEETVIEALGMNDPVEKEKAYLEGQFAGHRILLVEDIEINREIVMALLGPTGLEIDCAENGSVAVKKFSEAPDKYEMIFMDLQMPEMDGYEATRRIRALESELRSGSKSPEFPSEIPGKLFQGIPIIAMTANVFKEDVDKCIETGMNSHVGKPLDFDEVIEKLCTFLA